MSKPTNESSCKPIFKTNQKKDLDAELLNNLLLPKKTQVTYSEPNQDAELPSKIIELTDTKTCGLCHDKNQGQNLLWISLVSMKRSIAQLLWPTVPKIKCKYQHQSISIPVDCIDLPGLKPCITKVRRCTHMQPPSHWIWMHTCTWQALKEHTCTSQAHYVSNLPWCYSMLSAHLVYYHVWLVHFRKQSCYFITSQAAFPDWQRVPNVCATGTKQAQWWGVMVIHCAHKSARACFRIII